MAFLAVVGGGSAGRVGCVAGSSAVFGRLRICCFVEEDVGAAGGEDVFVRLAADTGSFVVLVICAGVLGLASPSRSGSLTRRRFVARDSVASSVVGTCCRP